MKCVWTAGTGRNLAKPSWFSQGIGPPLLQFVWISSLNMFTSKDPPWSLIFDDLCMPLCSYWWFWFLKLSDLLCAACSSTAFDRHGRRHGYWIWRSCFDGGSDGGAWEAGGEARWLSLATKWALCWESNLQRCDLGNNLSHSCGLHCHWYHLDDHHGLFLWECRGSERPQNVPENSWEHIHLWFDVNSCRRPCLCFLQHCVLAIYQEEHRVRCVDIFDSWTHVLHHRRGIHHDAVMATAWHLGRRPGLAWRVSPGLCDLLLQRPGSHDGAAVEDCDSRGWAAPVHYDPFCDQCPARCSLVAGMHHLSPWERHRGRRHDGSHKVQGIEFSWEGPCEHGVVGEGFSLFTCSCSTSSTAQGGGGSFKNRKPIGEIGCCESGMAERIHWWTERCLRSPLFLSLSLSFSDYLPTYLSIYLLSIYLSISIYISISIPISISIYLSTYLSLYLSILSYLSIYLSIHLSIYLSIYLSIHLSIYLFVYLSVYLSTCLSVVQCHSV